MVAMVAMVAMVGLTVPTALTAAGAAPLMVHVVVPLAVLLGLRRKLPPKLRLHNRHKTTPTAVSRSLPQMLSRALVLCRRQAFGI